MLASFIIFWSVLITTILSDNISHCNDECLLFKLKANGVIQKTDIILSMDNALIWIHPSDYFSDMFLKKFTNKEDSTNNDFRQAFYNKYIKPNNVSLILQINSNDLKETNIEYLNDMISDNNNIIKNKLSRQMLSYPNHYTEYDIMNQNTWDEYDWILAGFTEAAFGLCCLCCGWCCHKKYMSNMIISDAYIDEYIDDDNDDGIKVSVFSPRKAAQSDDKKKMSFAGSTTNDEYHAHKQHIQQRQSKIGIKVIEVPTKRTSIVPKYKTDNPNVLSPKTAGDVLSPDSTEPSGSHVSIAMFSTPNESQDSSSDNPYANITNQLNGLDIIEEIKVNEKSEKPVTSLMTKLSNTLSRKNILLGLIGEAGKDKIPSLKPIQSASNVLSPSANEINNPKKKLCLRPTKSQPTPKSPNVSTPK